VGDGEHPWLQEVGGGEVGGDGDEPRAGEDQPADGAEEVEAGEAEGGCAAGLSHTTQTGRTPAAPPAAAPTGSPSLTYEPARRRMNVPGVVQV